MQTQPRVKCGFHPHRADARDSRIFRCECGEAQVFHLNRESGKCLEIVELEGVFLLLGNVFVRDSRESACGLNVCREMFADTSDRKVRYTCLL